MAHGVSPSENAVEVEMEEEESPTPSRPNGPKATGSIGRRLEAAALPIAWLVVIILFGVLKPDTFLSIQNFSSIFASQAVLVVISLALMLVLMVGDFDLSVAAVAGLSAMTIAILNIEYGWPVGLAIIAALLVGALVGFINGLFIVVGQVQSLIVTLGMGSVVTGIVLWISNTSTYSGISRSLVEPVILTRFFGIPLAFYYALAFGAVLWYATQMMPVGRRLLVVGRNRDVAQLSGIRVGRVRWVTLISAGTIAAAAGVLYAGVTGSAGPSSAVDLLLPAFAACFLGQTTITPGRFNAWGVVIAVYFLVTGTTGLQLLGAESFVQNIFYGAALVLAVTFSNMVRRRREAAGQA